MPEGRNTKYTDALREALVALGHATNAQLLERLQRRYPELSATTVHRITTRLQERGEIGIAPNAMDGSMRYDAQIVAHDHFCCSICGRLHDIVLPKSCWDSIAGYLNGCKITGNVIISGACSTCHTKEGDVHE